MLTFNLLSWSSYGRFPKPRYAAHPQDCSVMTYRGHAVLRTLIRCHFSPAETTGSQYIYSGSADGKIHVKQHPVLHFRMTMLMVSRRSGLSMVKWFRFSIDQRLYRCRSTPQLLSQCLWGDMALKYVSVMYRGTHRCACAVLLRCRHAARFSSRICPKATCDDECGVGRRQRR
jgi:hypothetical protein